MRIYNQLNTFPRSLMNQTCCTSSLPLVPSAGSVVCQNSCSSNIYILNSTANMCNATCALPFGIQSTSLGSPAAYLCSACSSPKFVQRSNSSCVTSCSYVNSTTVNSTAVSVCESSSDISNCHYQLYLNASAYYCVSSCFVVISGTICCPSSAPLVSSAGSQACISNCSANTFIVNGTVNQCASACSLPNATQSSSLGSPAAFLCSACASPNS